MFIPGEVEVLLNDVVGFAVWRTVELLVFLSITSPDLMDCMIPNVTWSSGSPQSKGKYKCWAQFMITENVTVDFGEGLPALFIISCQLQYWTRP